MNECTSTAVARVATPSLDDPEPRSLPGAPPDKILFQKIVDYVESNGGSYDFDVIEIRQKSIYLFDDYYDNRELNELFIDAQTRHSMAQRRSEPFSV